MSASANTPNKQIVVRYMRARATKDLEALDSILATGFSHEMRGDQQDREGLLNEVTAFPLVDSEIEFDALVEEADQVACRYRWRGRTPEGKPIAFTGLFIANLRSGQLVSGWGEFDARFLRELAQG